MKKYLLILCLICLSFCKCETYPTNKFQAVLLSKGSAINKDFVCSLLVKSLNYDDRDAPGLLVCVPPELLVEILTMKTGDTITICEWQGRHRFYTPDCIKETLDSGYVK